MPTPTVDLLKDDSDMTMHSHVASDVTGLDLSGYVEVAGDTMTGALVITPTTNGTSIFNVTNQAGTSVLKVDTTNQIVGIGASNSTAKFSIKDSSSLTTLSSEMITNADDRTFASDLSHWSGTNWSIGSGVATHVAGANTYSLPNAYLTASPVAGQVYKVSYKVVTTTVGTIQPSIGGSAITLRVGQIVGTQYLNQYVVAINTNPLTFTPSSTWAGYIDNISVKLATASSVPFAIEASDGTSSAIEIRSSYDGSKNFFIGPSAGKYAHTYDSYENFAIGCDVLQYTNDGANVAIGNYAMQYGVDVSQNCAIGNRSMQSAIYGYVNMALGEYSLSGMVTGSYNVAIGASAGAGSANGYTGANYNILFGYQSAYKILSGASNNTIIGYQSGYNLGAATSNVFIGYQAGYNETNSNRLYVANSNTSTPLIYGLFTGTGAGITIHSQATDGIPLIVKGKASQSSNLQDWRNSSGTPLTYIEADGEIVIDQDSKGVKLGADQDITIFSAGSGDVTITPLADTDLTINFVGTTNSGVLVWMEDEDYFKFDDDVLFNSDAIGFFGTAPVTKATELTDELTTITHTAPSTPDYAIQDLVDSSAGATFGFATKDEGNSVLAVIANLQARVNELETTLVNYGLLADAD